MKNTLPARFARVRMAVAFLGEAGSANWWSSSFLSQNGLAVAAYNFPRAAGYAALNSSSAAAKRLHDERIGRRRCVHLFRLSLGDETLIQRALERDGCQLLGSLPRRRDDAVTLLEAESRELISIDPGPVQVGASADAFTEPGLAELAKHYLAAFRQDLQCLPYFASARR